VAQRFFRRGVSKVFFVPTVADLDSPSRPEITAGVNLSSQISDISGFSIENSPITTPDLESTFDSQIDGPDAAADSRLTFYDLSDDDDIRVALAKGENGYIVLMPYGDVATKRAEVWPVRSTGYNDQWDLGAVAATAIVGFAITDEPEQNAVIPAA
jgi:hypothetical protein